MKKLLLLLLLFVPTVVMGQQFLWNVNLDTRFDNREYAKMDNAIHQTLFSSKLSPSVGLGWGEGNSINVGADVWIDFGADFGSISPEMVINYKYQSEKYAALVGIVPRSELMGEYSRAFFSDSVSFYDTNLSGLILQYKSPKFYVELSLDWVGRQSETEREKFRVFSSAEYSNKWYFAGYYVSMFHFANTNYGGGVVDNILAQPYVGVDLSKISNMDKLSVKASWINAFQCDRKYVGEYVLPAGAEINISVEKFRFGIDNTLYIGDNLMPYYDSYGAELYSGETFYRTENGLYNRLEVYYNPRLTKFLELKVSSVHHFDGKNWGSQQIAKLIVNLNRGDFPVKKREKNKNK